jgi:hypothetical protein
MAPDLIPPPSPAGKRQPDDGAEERAADQALLEAAQPHVREEPSTGPAPYRGRFGFIWGVLAGTAVCVAALGVVLTLNSGDDGPKLAKNWSSWKPSTSRMLAGAADIAAHVGREYKQDSGDQLATVTSGDIEAVGPTPVRVAVRPKGGELQVLDGPGVLYLLSGLGDDAQTVADPAARRNERLMMREGVELALYSFRYLDDITMVGVMLPPRSDRDGQQARTLFFRPGDLLDKLQVPLDRTLSPKPPRPKAITQQVSANIDSLTLRNLFLAQLQQLESQQQYLVLAPPEVLD